MKQLEIGGPGGVGEGGGISELCLSGWLLFKQLIFGFTDQAQKLIGQYSGDRLESDTRRRVCVCA